MRWTLLWMALWSAGCGSSVKTAPPPVPDWGMFAQQAYPVLLRDCGFAECHGNTDRFFHIFGPGRTRLTPGMESYDPATNEEIQFSYDRARSMLDASDIEGSLLLRKPLEESEGGVGHRGTDELGRDVYTSADAPRLQVLRAWASMQPLATPPPGATP